MITRSTLNTRYTPEDVYSFTRDGNADQLIISLDQGDNSTNWYRDYIGDTAGHVAIMHEHINCVEILLDNGYDVNSKNETGSTLLHYAANDRINIVEMLLNRGIDINSKDTFSRGTALHYAAHWGNINIVIMLLERGIDIDDDIDEYAPGPYAKDISCLIFSF